MEYELLRKAELFKDLGPDEMEVIGEICDFVELKYGDFVFREGDEGDRLYIIESGEVRISRNVPGIGEEALTVLKPGALFGEMAVLDRTTRSTDAIVHSRCRLLTISREDFVALLDSDRDLAYKMLWSIVRLLSHRLRVTNDNLRSILVMAMF